MSTADFNLLETEFLFCIEFELHVTPEDFAQYYDHLASHGLYTSCPLDGCESRSRVPSLAPRESSDEDFPEDASTTSTVSSTSSEDRSAPHGSAGDVAWTAAWERIDEDPSRTRPRGSWDHKERNERNQKKCKLYTGSAASSMEPQTGSLSPAPGNSSAAIQNFDFQYDNAGVAFNLRLSDDPC